ELVNFIEERGLYWLDFLRIGAQVKREQSRHQTLHFTGADVIGQAHLLADTNEETRSEIAACFIDQFQRVPIRAGEARTPEAHPYPALSFVFAALDSFRFAQWCGRFCVCQSKRAGLHFSEGLLDELLYLGCFNVAKDIDHTVLPNDVAVTKIGQIFLRQVLHSFDRAV